MTATPKSITKAIAAMLTITVLSLQPSLSRAADGDIVVISRFYPAAGSEADFETFFRKAAAYVHEKEPQVIYRLHRTTKEPVAFVWYEAYPSREALDTHRKTTLPAFGKEAGEFPKEKLARPPEIEILQLLAGG